MVVLVGVDQADGKRPNADVNYRYGNPPHFGLAAPLVLDSNGKQLTTKDTGKLEEPRSK